VSQVAVVTRLAVRELWITFRMLVMLTAFVGAGAVAALMPGAPVEILRRLALGLAAATAVTAGIVAWSFAEERASGRAGWLVTRSVPRGTYLLAWFVAAGVLALLGLAAAATLGWLAVAVVATIEPGPFAAVVAAIGADIAAAISLGLLLAALSRPMLASIAAVASCALVAATAASAAPAGGVVAHGLLVGVGAGDEVLPAAFRAAGIGLVLASVLLVLARLAMARADL